LDKFQTLNLMLKEQARVASDIEKEIAALQGDDLFSENDTLRKTIIELEDFKQRLTDENTKISTENRRLKNELYEQLFNEKTKLVGKSEQMLEAYFASSVSEEKNRLTQLEQQVKTKIDEMQQSMQQSCVDEQNILYSRLDMLKRDVDDKLEAIRRENDRLEQEIYREGLAGLEHLKKEPLSDESIVNRGKQNNWEAFLGLKLFNKLGIALVIFGVIAYAFTPESQGSNMLKGVLIFLLGITMLAFGEMLNRKRPDVFSLGLTSGGIAVLYSGTALSFFLLNIITMYPALILCVLVTTAALVLSVRYNSQTIAAFAIIGGYLPLSSIAEDETLVYFAMGYFIILNIFALSVACLKKWHTTQFIGFFANLSATIFIISLLSYSIGTAATVAAVSYVFFSFIVYTAIPLISSYRTSQKLKAADNVLLSLNTFFGSITMLWVFSNFGLWSYAGLMAIGFGVFYMISAKLIEKIMPVESPCHALFYITGLAFAILVIPFQFGMADLSTGWLIEGVLLVSYGILAERKMFRVTGWIVCSLCLFVFLSIDILINSSVFFNRYIFITAGSIIILGALLYKKRKLKGGDALFKYLTVTNLWIFMLYTIYKFSTKVPGEQISMAYALGSLGISLSFLYAYLLSRIKFISDKPIRVISWCIYIYSFFSLIIMNARGLPYVFEPSAASTAIGTAVLVIANLVGLFAAHDLLLRLTLGRKLGVEWYPICISAFFVFLLSQNLIVSFDLSFNSVVLTVIFAATSLFWVLFGFIRRYQYIRLFGLGLSFVTAIKLFMVDLTYLGDNMRIISYFSLGVVLLAISFLYQYFSKRLERISVSTKISGEISTEDGDENL